MSYALGRRKTKGTLMEKIKLKQAIIVEGKYDKITLSQLVDGVIITTDGFGIYNSEETVKLIRFYAQTCGIIIMTDSDSAGMQIRGKIKGIVNKGSIVNVYIPEIFGKEKRKSKPSKEGKLGVEGMSVEILRNALVNAGVINGDAEIRESVTKTDFITLGLSGSQDSARLRRLLAKSLDLPEKLSSAALRDAVSVMFGRKDFLKYFDNFIKEKDNGQH